MFGFDGDEVFAFGFVEVCRAFDGEVVGLGRATGEDDFFGIGVNQGGDVGAGFFDSLFCFPAECMAVGSGVAEGLMNVCKGNDMTAVAAVFLFNDALQRNAAEVVIDGFV